MEETMQPPRVVPPSVQKIKDFLDKKGIRYNFIAEKINRHRAFMTRWFGGETMPVEVEAQIYAVILEEYNVDLETWTLASHETQK